MSLKSTIICFVLLAFTVFHSVSAHAMANVSLLPLPDGKSWNVQATGFENIAGVELTITYDSTAASAPKVVPGSFVAGAMFLPNTTKAGSIRIGIATTKILNASGPIATISFGKVSGAAKISLTSVNIIGNDLARAPVTASNPTDQDAGTTEPKGDSTSHGDGQQDQYVNNQRGQTGYQPPSTGSGVVVTGGTITMPSETTTPAEERKSDPTPEYKEEAQREAPAVARDTNGEPASKQQESAKPQEIRIVPAKSVLTRFKEYKGEMTSKALIDLFAVDEKAVVRQVPPIMIADGKSTLKIIIPGSEGKGAPNFALKKAKLASLKMSRDNNWIVETKPEKGATDVSVTMLLGDTAVEIPVNCAPKADVDLDKTGKIDENDFRLFLKDRGTIKAPKYDVNNDGSLSYIDDYIFTANFIASQPKVKEKAGAKATEKTKDVKQPKDTAEKKVKAKTK